MSDDSYRHQVIITIPSARADELEERVDAALGAAGILDGAGHDGEATELFVYGPRLDPLLDALLTVDYPPGSRADISVTDLEAGEETTMQLQLAGARKGRRSRVRIRPLAGSVGDLVAFDLGEGEGYVPARLSHVSTGYVIAWFFASVHDCLPDRRAVGKLTSDDALIALRCFRDELSGPPWTVQGPSETFDQTGWPLPELERVFPPTGRHAAVRLDPKTLTQDQAWEIPEDDWWQRSPETSFDHKHLPDFLKLAMTDLPAAVRSDWTGRRATLPRPPADGTGR